MRRFILFCLVVGLCIACKHKTGPAIIPEKKFKEVLIGIHLIDGYYMMHFNKYINVKDSNSFYKQVLDRNGFSREQFDSSLAYYSRDPKRFEAIYEDIITEFNRMSQDITDVRSLIIDTAKNFYKGRHNIIVKGQGYADKLPFKVAIKDTGLYTITIQLQIFDDDMSKDVKLTAFGTNVGKAINPKFTYFDRIIYNRIPQLKVYRVSKRITDRSQKFIRGFMLDQTDQKHKFHRHITVAWFFVNKTANLAVPVNPVKTPGSKRPLDPRMPKNLQRDFGRGQHVP